jgi:hypothetical protein
VKSRKDGVGVKVEGERTIGMFETVLVPLGRVGREEAGLPNNS